MTEQIPTNVKRKKSLILISSLVVLVLICASFGLYSFHAWRKAVAANPTTAQKSIIAAVDSIAVTPNETPEIATVKDASKLTSTALAQVAKNGDQLLIYNQSNRIFVYRPSNHKLVDMLSVQAPSAAVSNSSATTKNATSSSDKK